MKKLIGLTVLSLIILGTGVLAAPLGVPHYGTIQRGGCPPLQGEIPGQNDEGGEGMWQDDGDLSQVELTRFSPCPTSRANYAKGPRLKPAPALPPKSPK